eukprot:2931-Heterococcus_DN1.PRE.4
MQHNQHRHIRTRYAAGALSIYHSPSKQLHCKRLTGVLYFFMPAGLFASYTSVQRHCCQS